MDRIVRRGNTVIAIEHNLDVMKQADISSTPALTAARRR